MESAAERRLFWGTAGAVVVSDFITKMLAESLLARRLPLAVLGDVVQLRLVYNQGAAFGLDVGENSRYPTICERCSAAIAEIENPLAAHN